MRHPRGPGPTVLALLLALTAGCTAAKERPLTPDDTVRAATRLLVDRCLTERGLTPPRPGEHRADSPEARRVTDAYFGTGRAELSLTLPGGYTVSQHTDGCLAAAQRRLYGDQGRWFRASTSVNNLKAKASPGDRAAYRELRKRALVRAAEILGR
ncbi:hypothetical protein SRB5_48520 [Streptomyces sp. RB5]|uniref:Lipoprotein n=1 Tax=Streptomyces smaragdinus TaxID=2585196 RepID=A0A7K0CMH7_9ACTN|nr:hypothetical protein [Streptomyces smaragdinus]MQY14676.1 hypothetical protein [Streptomyces smaragdinus]